MSDLVTGALLALGGGLVGSLATIAIARASRKDILRLAAVERRLQAHQEAYALWFELLNALHGPECHNVVVKCQAWWKQNCLYLDPKSRRAFWNGSIDAALYQDLKGQQNPKEAFATLNAVLGYLAKGVGLPTIGEHEFAKPGKAVAR
jgi:hypothetical protein